MGRRNPDRTDARRSARLLEDASGLSSLNEDQIAERGARMARREAREYREYLSAEQRRQPGCPAREVVLDQRGQATRLRVVRAVARDGVDFRRDLRVARRADAVAELRVGVRGDVAFHLLPVLVVAANPLAVAADRQQSPQLLDVRQRGFEVRDALAQLLLQPEHARADGNTRAQLLRIERLDDVVVGARV